MADDFQPSEMLWQMIFNPLKCYVLKITKKKKTVDFDYNINGQILETVTSNPYLGAQLTNTMSWEKQVQKVVTKGNKALGFIRRIVGSCPEGIKKQAYLALVRPHLEYAKQRLGPSSPKTYSTDGDGPTASSTLHQKQLLKRLWYSDNITRTTGITTTFNKEKNSPYHTFT